jgi:hypothetical protein
MPSKLRICWIIIPFSRPTVGQQILKRACTLRSEMKVFLAYLNEDRVEELANELHNFITDCVNNIENAELVSREEYLLEH